MCRVALGKSFLVFSAMKMAHSPPGHHSVTGRPSVGGLAYAEYVVYRGEQVRTQNKVRPYAEMEALLYLLLRSNSAQVCYPLSHQFMSVSIPCLLMRFLSLAGSPGVSSHIPDRKTNPFHRRALPVLVFRALGIQLVSNCHSDTKSSPNL